MKWGSRNAQRKNRIEEADRINKKHHRKNYPTYDVLGIQFGLHRSNAFRKVNRFMGALQIALKGNGSLPAESIGELNKRLEGVKLVIIDGTEQRKNRPKDNEKQKNYYSGKKNITR